MNLARRALLLIANEGWSAVWKRAKNRFNRPINSYSRWVQYYDCLSNKSRQRMEREIASWITKPVVSVVIPLQNSEYWSAGIQSVQDQVYRYWNLCLLVDGSIGSDIRDQLGQLVHQDNRIRIFSREGDEDIAVRLNAALSSVEGDFVTFARPFDTLAPHAFFSISKEIISDPTIDLLFSDYDQIDAHGHRFGPVFKPDWNPALMMSQNAFSNLGVYRMRLIRRVGGFRPGCAGMQDYDLVLRCAGETEADRIRHIPKILYHERITDLIRPAEEKGTSESWQAGQRAIQDYLAKQGIRATVGRAGTAGYQVQYSVPLPHPRVSVVIASSGEPSLLKPCLTSLLSLTTYDNFEVLLLVNEVQKKNPERAKVLNWAASQQVVQIVSYSDRPFNYSWVNNFGVSQASGDIICFLNDDTKLITPDWLEKLVARVTLKGVGAVGAMLYDRNNTIQHVGITLGIGGVGKHVLRGEPRGTHGYFGRGCFEQDVSCVTGACMVIRKQLFYDLGGLDEGLPIAFNDVDLCMRIRAAGWRILWTPTVELYHYESASLGRHDSPERANQFAKSVSLMKKRWGPMLDSDPYYNSNLSLQRDYALASPPR